MEFRGVFRTYPELEKNLYAIGRKKWCLGKKISKIRGCFLQLNQIMVKNTTVKKLLDALAEKTGQSLDYHGYWKMSDALESFALEKKMTSISQGYLADTYRNIKKKLDNNTKESRTSRDHLDTIACYLGYKSFEQFSSSVDKPISDVFHSCMGNWWSYVRSNSGDFLLKAPVRIYRDEKSMEVYLEMQGKERKYKGKMLEYGSCLSGFIQSNSEKVFSLIFKLSNSQKQDVLQGVFSGMSSFGNPIAGKELLVRETNLNYQDMQWTKLPMTDNTVSLKIKDYFKDSEKTNIKISEYSDFEWI